MAQWDCGISSNIRVTWQVSKYENLYHGCYYSTNQVAHFKVDKSHIYLSTNLSTS